MAFTAAVVVAVCAGPGVARLHAQQEGVAQPASFQGRFHEDTYGTSAPTNHVYQAFAFQPPLGSSWSVIAANPSGSRFCTAACGLYADVMLPAGASIVGMELEACDTDAAADVNVSLVRIPNLEGAGQNLGIAFTTGTPGCAFVNVAVAHTVDNETGTYQLRVTMNGTSATVRFQAVRLIYRLQVSPAPATASFPNDVPTTHPFFRFVEALAAAGISGGCAAGSYCPNLAVSRGEMAVFLSVALGLHFPN
jgi:hypothetical protein